MNQNALKLAAAKLALDYVEDNVIIGVGTGSTVNFFIAELIRTRARIKAAVSSSVASSDLLRAGGFEVMELNDAGPLSIYVDGADEITRELAMIKGGGAALTREKIVAAASEKFICIADGSKLVDVLGNFPLPIEVIPMARSSVARQLVVLGGQPKVREGFTTDNGNIILDVRGLNIMNPVELESTLDHIAGVVTNGLFARRAADVLLLGTTEGVKTMTV